MDVLVSLIHRQGEVVERMTLLDEIWNDDEAADDSLTRAISLLRKAFGNIDEMTYIETIPKRGYRLVPPVIPDCDQAPILNGQSRSDIGIAVLPFQTFDEVGGEFFLAEGVVEEVSSRLGAISDISLVGRTSIGVVTTQGLTSPEIARKLNVSHLIEGAVHRTSQIINITIRLIDGQSGTEVWSQRLDGEIEDFIDSRQTISASILESLGKALGVEPSPAPAARMTKDRDAYALYLQGRALIQRGMVEGAIAKAVELLEHALELDPEFAECWTALAEAHIHITVYTPCLERVERSEQAATCARRALELDPGQGYALAILSIHEWTCFNPAGALEYAMEAYRLEPNNADVTLRLGSSLLYLGRTREALPYIEAAIEQDPVYGRNYAMLCAAHLNLGNIEAALSAGQSMVDLGIPGLHFAVAQAVAGDHEGAFATYYDARRFIGTLIMSPPGSTEVSDEARDYYLMTAAKGVCSGNAEDRQIYCNILEMLHQTLPEPYDQSVAWPAIWMGHSGLVMKLYRECIHPANMPGLMSLWADVEPINRTRNHPDFMSFAEDIGMVEAWEKFGWPDLIPFDPR